MEKKIHKEIVNSGSNEKGFLLTKEQYDVYVWLKQQGLNTDDETLSFWAKTYESKRIKDVINFAHKRLSDGQKIVNIGGWVHKLLKTDCAVVNERSNENLEYAHEFVKANNWKELRIFEKYVKDTVTNEDLPLELQTKDFQRALQSLFEKSSTYNDL